jgi:malate dehydrogenase (oxaloacetate-decarboxylating)
MVASVVSNLRTSFEQEKAMTTKHVLAADGALKVDLSGYDLINDPLLNKGTAFTEEERDELHLHGILPPHVGSLDDQIARRMEVVRHLPDDFQKYAYLRDLQDTNETLFYALLARHIEEMLPLVYTPAVGEGCQRFSTIWRKPRGLFLSYSNRHRIRDILEHSRNEEVRAIVVSDGERILGLGDQGAGGMGIPIGKLALYTACAGIDPVNTLPILLDVGTDNQERLADPVYVGWRHERIRGAEYDEFIELFVEAVISRWPNVLLQWEDFARDNAGRLLQRYRDRLCTFNDDIQGTAAVATGTLLASIKVSGVPLAEQRIAILGAGTAGCGIASLLLQAIVDAGVPQAQARRQFYAVDRDGLLVEGMPDIQDFQRPFVQSREAVAGWKLPQPGRISLLDVVTNAQPTALIGVSGQPGTFTEQVVRTMAGKVSRPVIFPLSNPTSRSEATPQDLVDWTAGQAVIGTGSPFPPVKRGGSSHSVDQTNNAYIFPGVGLGVLAINARRVTDSMFMAAAQALAGVSPAASNPAGTLLPPVERMREVAEVVAVAVARQAQREGVADRCDQQEIAARVRGTMWEPVYKPYRRMTPERHAKTR